MSNTEKFILKGVLQTMCGCEKGCSVPSYPGRIYDKKWDCKTQRWIKDNTYFNRELNKIDKINNEKI
jgi:hypothetical protein